MTRAVRGVGLALRWDFVDDLVERTRVAEGGGLAPLPIDFLEISPENYVGRGGRQSAALEWLADRYAIVTHGLTLSIGGYDPFEAEYLREVAAIVARFESPWHSDHLCFGSVDGRVLHELLPVAFTRANVARVADRIRRARDALRVPLAIENVTYYWHPGRADVGEAEFLAAVCQAADCGLLLDVNNAYVNAVNFGFDVDAWMRAAPLDRVVQIHAAGHEWFTVDDRGIGEPSRAGEGATMIIDTHGADVAEPVLALLARVTARTGPVPIVLERDHAVPPLDALCDELRRLRAYGHGRPQDSTG